MQESHYLELEVKNMRKQHAAANPVVNNFIWSNQLWSWESLHFKYCTVCVHIVIQLLLFPSSSSRYCSHRHPAVNFLIVAVTAAGVAGVPAGRVSEWPWMCPLLLPPPLPLPAFVIPQLRLLVLRRQCGGGGGGGRFGGRGGFLYFIIKNKTPPFLV